MSLIALGCECEPDCPPISGTPGPPGPTGPVGPIGPTGIDGQNAFGITTAPFVVPPVGSTVTVEVDPAQWATATQVVYLQGVGYYEVADTSTRTTMVLINLGYPDNLLPGVSIGTGIQVSPAGPRGAQGPPWVLTSPLGINLGGTGGATPIEGFDNLSPLTGPMQVIGHDQSHNVAVVAPIPGLVLTSDSTVPTGLKWVPPSDLQIPFDDLAPTRIRGDIIVHDGATNVRVGVPNAAGLVLTVDPFAESGVSWQGINGFAFTRTSIAQTPFVLRGTEDLVGISTPSVPVPVHVVLPSVSNWTTTFLIIKDESGTADQFPITITTGDGSLIQGRSDYVINIPYGKVFLYSNGFSFFAL